MSPLPKVSVGMPIFNGERFLNSAIESILNQDEPNLELILADNASTDATADICRYYESADSRVRFVTSDRNRGVAWNFNRLVDLARAKYFKWADCDDLVEPSLLRRCVEALEAEPNTVLAYSWARYIDENGETLRSTVEVPDYGLAISPVARARGFLRLPSSHVLELQGVILRDHLAATSMMGPYAASDLALILELAMRGSFAQVAEPLFLHRMHNARVSTSSPNPRELSRVHSENGHAVLLPRWFLLAMFARGILASPAPRSQQLRSLPFVGVWAARHWQQLGYDVVALMPGPVSAAADKVRNAARARRGKIRSMRPRDGTGSA
jgi:glycosyltransferase involved in cell wall biosynthesis